MNAVRTAVLLSAAAVTLAVSFSSPASANAPPPEFEPSIEAPLPDGVSAPMTVELTAQANGQAVLVIPRKLIDRAVAARAEAPTAKSEALPLIATVAGGGALSLGVLLLGIYLIRRPNRRAQAAVAGTAAAVALFVGAGVVFADLIPGRPLGPIPDREDRVVQPKPDQPQVKFVIVDEGDTIELTLPRTFLPKK